MLGHKSLEHPGVIHRFLKDLVGVEIFSHTGAMNNTFQHPERPPYPLPPAPARPPHPGQPLMYPPPGAHMPRESKKLNPYGTISLAMMLLMACLGLANFFFFGWELNIVLPTGFTWLGAMGLGIGALFMKGREKITAIIALILGVLIIVAVPIFLFLALAFIIWVGSGFA